MKIKLAILDADKNYLTRMVSSFNLKYSDKFEIYSFTDQATAMSTLGISKIDVLLSSDLFEIDTGKLPNRCAFAYLVDTTDIESINDQHAICKFQRADLIYKQILSVYSEKASAITGFKMSDEAGQVIVFCSASGGVGSSTMAAACAVRFATQGKKVLYLNLEKFGCAGSFFEGQGQFDMSDLIFALKSKKPNLRLKLDSCVKQDTSGVYFYSETKIALDMLELTAEDILRLLSEIKLAAEYDAIILDMDFSLDKNMLSVYRQAQAIVLVGDGSAESNSKTERAVNALVIMEQNEDAPLVNRMEFTYNKVSSKTGQTVNIPGIKILGGTPRYAGATARQIVDQLAEKSLFDEIL